MDVWCYTIYGRDTDAYYLPMIKNIEVANDLDVVVIISTIEEDYSFVREFFKKYNIKIISFNGYYHKKYPKMLRYLVPLYFDYENYFFKDSDSFVTLNEISIMEEWKGGGNSQAIIIRDHPLHISPIMAGMFGLKKPAAINVASQVEEGFQTNVFDLKSPYNYDQLWLVDNVYPKIKSESSVYTSYFAYFGEKITFFNSSDTHIGEQHFQAESEKADLMKFKKNYNGMILSAPHFYLFSQLYQKSRLVLAFAKIIDFLGFNCFKNVKKYCYEK